MGVRVVAAALVLGAVAACTDNTVPTAPVGIAQLTQGELPGRYIVTLRPGAKLDHPGITARYGKVLNGFACRGCDSAALSRDPAVLRVEADGMAFPSYSWGLDRIGQRSLPLDAAVSFGRTGVGTTGYIIDTGLEYTHSEFQGRASFGADILGGDGSDCNGHGTHVGGTFGGVTYGIARQARLVSVRVFGCTGGAAWSTIIAAMDWVAANHVKPAVANMSLGGSLSQAVNDATAALVAQGVTVVVAAGNSNADASGFSPASTPQAITVGATSSNDYRASFSNWGSAIDLFAPGASIKSAWLNGGVSTISGTSMASPHVAGVAALYLQENPGASPAQVDSAIKARATKCVVSEALSAAANLLYSGTDDDTRSCDSPPAPVPPAAPTDLALSFSNYSKAKGGTVTIRATWKLPPETEAFISLSVDGKAVHGGGTYFDRCPGTDGRECWQRADVPAGLYRLYVRAYVWSPTGNHTYGPWAGPVELCATESRRGCR